MGYNMNVYLGYVYRATKPCAIRIVLCLFYASVYTETNENLIES